jgi:hypothetical protein
MDGWVDEETVVANRAFAAALDALEQGVADADVLVTASGGVVTGVGVRPARFPLQEATVYVLDYDHLDDHQADVAERAVRARDAAGSLTWQYQ